MPPLHICPKRRIETDRVVQILTANQTSLAENDDPVKSPCRHGSGSDWSTRLEQDFRRLHFSTSSLSFNNNFCGNLSSSRSVSSSTPRSVSAVVGPSIFSGTTLTPTCLQRCLLTSPALWRPGFICNYEVVQINPSTPLCRMTNASASATALKITGRSLGRRAVPHPRTVAPSTAFLAIFGRTDGLGYVYMLISSWIWPQVLLDTVWELWTLCHMRHTQLLSNPIIDTASTWRREVKN